MRGYKLLAVVSAVAGAIWLWPISVVAEEAPAVVEGAAPASAQPATAPPSMESTGNQPPEMESVEESAAQSADAADSHSTSAEHAGSGGLVLGPEGVDDRGRRGRLHTVLRGHTLWDISAAYLGTPWVWPSVWIDNDGIENPHLILPGDRIWITANEMRVVTEAEAEAYLSASEPEETESGPVAFEPEPAPLAALEADEPSTLDTLPATLPGTAADATDEGREITVSRRESMGFVSAERLAASSTILDSPSDRTFLVEGDVVYIGLGEGQTAVGDRFTVFSDVEEVRDVETKRLLGHHVETLGWLEVRELTGDTAIAMIRMSYAEIPRGVRIVPRLEAPRTVAMRRTPDAIEGRIVFLPSSRTVMADGGYVYLNRGELHGVEPGSDLEVYDSGAVQRDPSRGVDVRTPDHRVARLVVVSVEPDSSVAFVLNAKRELEVGDSVRAVVPTLARSPGVAAAVR